VNVGVYDVTVFQNHRPCFAARLQKSRQGPGNDQERIVLQGRASKAREIIHENVKTIVHSQSMPAAHCLERRLCSDAFIHLGGTTNPIWITAPGRDANHTRHPSQCRIPSAVSDLRAWSDEQLIAAAKKWTKSSLRGAVRTSYETSLLCDSSDHTKTVKTRKTQCKTAFLVLSSISRILMEGPGFSTWLTPHRD